MNKIEIRNLCKAYGEKTVLKDLSLTVTPGELNCIMAPSGYGKTTLLRILAGLETPDSGTVTGVPEKLSFVLQEDRLCEDFCAVSNVRFATGKTVSKAQITDCLEKLGLPDGNIPVKKLSGGMKRRVAIARALCSDWDLLIMDEPFKGLDAALKQNVMDYVKERIKGKTVLFVTHDSAEAAYMGGSCIRL